MGRKTVSIFILVLCLGLVLGGCAKKEIKKDEPSAQSAAAGEKAAKIEAEKAAQKRAEQQAKDDAARIKSADDARKAQADAQADAQAKKDFEKSLVAKKEPGIGEGPVFDSKLLKDIYFEFDRYDIRAADAEILKGNAAILKKNPNLKVQIEGHCDERGTIEYNLALGERRANSTKKYLISLGIPADRVSTISYGEEKPLDPGKSEDAWSKNRRAHTIILSK